MFSLYTAKLVRQVGHNTFAMSADHFFLSGTFYGNWVQASAFQRSASTIAKIYFLASLGLCGIIVLSIPDLAAKLKYILAAATILYAAKTATLRLYLLRNARR